jgi:hypothetical protein
MAGDVPSLTNAMIVTPPSVSGKSAEYSIIPEPMTIYYVKFAENKIGLLGNGMAAKAWRLLKK